MSSHHESAKKKRHRRFAEVAVASGLVTADQLEAVRAGADPGVVDATAHDRLLADALVGQGVLTAFQARELLAGRQRFRLGQYTVLDEIGRGGMGQVFKAEHSMMGREVAIKVLPRAKSTPESEAAFRREMRMLGRLDHENLVRAFDAGHDAMVSYLVTELVPGMDLRRLVRTHGPLEETAAAGVVAQAARGLAYAHSQGLVHRDVKPGNILVMQDGRVKVLDLGLAGSTLDEEAVRLGRVVGTMDYIAPEQIRTPDDVGPPADIYSLGCTLYFAVTGRVPFPSGTRKDKMRRHLHDAPEAIRKLAPHVGEAFARVVDDMMAKSIADRPQTADEVIARLRRWIPATPVPLPAPAATVESQDRSASWRRSAAAGLADDGQATEASSVAINMLDRVGPGDQPTPIDGGSALGGWAAGLARRVVPALAIAAACGGAAAVLPRFLPAGIRPLVGGGSPLAVGVITCIVVLTAPLLTGRRRRGPEAVDDTPSLTETSQAPTNGPSGQRSFGDG